MYSLSEAGRQLGISRRTVIDLAAFYGIPVMRHPSNARAKAIDEAGFQKIKTCLGRSQRKLAATA